MWISHIKRISWISIFRWTPWLHVIFCRMLYNVNGCSEFKAQDHMTADVSYLSGVKW